MAPELNDQIRRMLGVVPPAPATASASASASATEGPGKSGWAPPRPRELYRYTVNVTRTEYGSVEVIAADETDAFDIASGDDVHWFDTGDIDWGDTEQVSGIPDNEAELEEWDDTYSTKYDTDGQPWCSECNDCVQHASSLTTDPDDANRWLCADCLTDLHTNN